jgi:hypothetical protein
MALANWQEACKALDPATTVGTRIKESVKNV